jgi:putative aminopeptidase FrvX
VYEEAEKDSMLLKELSEAIGVSGNEAAVRQIILKAIEGHASDIQVDSMGNVLAHKPGTGENPVKVMLAAHMDEIGFMVTGFDGDGLIRFTNVGGIDARILPGLRVKVGDKQLPGVIIWTPIHLNRDQNVVKIENLRIDIGATSKDGASGKVKRGERIVFDSYYAELSADIVRGKAFDDRVGCSVLVDVLQGGPYPVDIVAAFTVQEEIGLRGARVAAQRFMPDVALVLEGTTAHDLPNPLANPDDHEPVNPTSKLGAGPALTVIDNSMITPPHLLRFLQNTAEAENIPYQFKTNRGGGTDAGSIHISSGGIPSAVISVPCRYIHSPVALLNRQDYANTLRLVQAALFALTSDIINRK